MPNIADLLQHALSPAHLTLLSAAGAAATRASVPLYLVGGSVRDLLLGRPVLDLDLVAEGDAVALASVLAGELGGQVKARSQFGTVKLQTPAATLDIITARSETYARSGALPTVRPGLLADDLARRDFTINALAVDLAPQRFGEMVDLFSGANDLRSRLLRALHERSFEDDATRILRGIRYEARLDARMEPATEALARRDARFLEPISPDRLRHELDRLFQEPQPEHCLARAQELGVLRPILPGLTWPPALDQAVAARRAQGQSPLPLVFLALLAWPLSHQQGDALAGRLNLGSRWLRVVQHTLVIREALAQLGISQLPPSAIYARLKDLEPEAVQAAALAAMDTPDAQARLEAFLACWRHVRPHLTARRLLALGVPVGPLVGRFLERLQAHRLDYSDATVQQQEALVRRWLRDEEVPRTPPTVAVSKETLSAKLPSRDQGPRQRKRRSS